MEQAELNPCKCGCGALVAGTWKRGHAKRGIGGGVGGGPGYNPLGDATARLKPLPRPGDLDDLPPEEFGPIIDIGAGVPEAGPSRVPIPDGPDSEPDDDEPPPHARREWRQPKRGRSGPAKTSLRVTAGIRGDIDAKIRFALQVPGTIWQARDPLCGGTFVQQIPETAEAFTDIVCDSPDLVKFFTGPGGSFMKFLKVGAALMPVAQVVMAHHVYHSIEEQQHAPSEPDYQQYAA